MNPLSGDSTPGRVGVNQLQGETDLAKRILGLMRNKETEMPYIDQKARPKLDSLTDPLIDHIRSLPLEEQDGVLDYVVTRMLMSLYHPPFFNFNRALGVLTAVTQEYYRVVIAPYEDEKIRELGPVEAKGQSGKSRAA